MLLTPHILMLESIPVFDVKCFCPCICSAGLAGTCPPTDLSEEPDKEVESEIWDQELGAGSSVSQGVAARFKKSGEDLVTAYTSPLQRVS